MEGVRKRYNNYRNGKKRPRKGIGHKGSSYAEKYKYYPYKTCQNDKTHTKQSYKNVSSRSASPVEGSEEYMTRKIQQTSAIIMRHLLSPNETVSTNKTYNNDQCNGEALLASSNITKKNTHRLNNKPRDKFLNRNKKANAMNVSAKEIHDKIMNHITNLNNGRKKNFINANNSTGLDDAINHMQQQKRLEISRILRDMNTVSDFSGEGGHRNLIVPDIGIKIDELPFDVIEELRQTLNLDLEYLNEAIADSSIANDCEESNNCERPLSVSSEDVDGFLQVNQEQINSVQDCIQNKCASSFEIKEEDIVDMQEEESQELNNGDMPAYEYNEGNQNPIHHSIWIKEEDELKDKTYSSGGSVCSNSTICVPNKNALLENRSEANNNKTVENEESHSANNSDDDNNELCDLGSSNDLKFLESTIKEFIEREGNLQCTEVDIALQKLDLVELCIRHLANYRRSLTQSIVSVCKQNSFSTKEDGTNVSQCSKLDILVTQSSQTMISKPIDDKYHIKKPRLMEPEEPEIKLESEDLMDEASDFELPKINERILAIERVGNELFLATESGNVIYLSSITGIQQFSLDVTNCIITSMAFVRGINDFIYMYVGSLEEVLRIYDVRKRHMIKASHIDDQIRCMDSMWDYVFMGCKNGSIIRYSCKKGKIEFEEKNNGSDILVLKAAQEGPRRVLLVGHRQAPIYVRDAMSGLYLRNFSNQAVTPTVYSIIISQGSLFCGTAKDNILVFSFHEGHLIDKIVAGDSKGISCMKIFKNLLYAGCYNGLIYVYNLKHKKMVTVLEGPGGSIVCMQVLSKRIIVGTLTGQFDSVILPSDIYSDV